jgi:hypothetical protein
VVSPHTAANTWCTARGTADVLGALQLTPWNGEPQHEVNPDAAVRRWAFGPDRARAGRQPDPGEAARGPPTARAVGELTGSCGTPCVRMRRTCKVNLVVAADCGLIRTSTESEQTFSHVATPSRPIASTCFSRRVGVTIAGKPSSTSPIGS